MRRRTPYVGQWPPVCLAALLLVGITGGCGGGGDEGGTEPTLNPTKLALITQPSTQGQSRVSLAAQPVIQLQDDQGTAVPQAGIPITASIATGGGSLGGTVTISTSASGLATFAQLEIGGLAGSRTLIFTSPNLASVTSGAIDLSSGAAAFIALNGGNAQNAVTGAAVTTAPSVLVTDADNNPVSGVAVTFQVTGGGGTVVPTTPITTNTAGVAAVTTWTLGGSPGPNSVSATASGLAGSPIVFGATGIGGASTISGTITVTSGALVRAKPPSTAVSSTIPRLTRTKSSRPMLAPHRDAQSRLALGQRRPRRPPEFTPDELIVTLRARSIGVPALGSRALAVRSNSAAAGASIRARLVPHLAAERLIVTGVSPAILSARIRVPQGVDIERVATALRTDPAVATVERNQIVRFEDESSPGDMSQPVRSSNDPFYSFQAWHYAQIDLPEAWAITTGSASVLVAVVDGGIRFDHPAIASNLTSDGYDFVTNSGPIPLCAGGTIDQSADGDGYDPDPTTPADYDFDSDFECLGNVKSSGAHGLHVAGTIGATGNDGVGVSGVNWVVRVRPVRVIGLAGGANYDIAQGLLYAAGLPADDGVGGLVQAPTGAKIINMSIGGPGASTVLENAVVSATNAGSLIIAAAGNTPTSEPNYPAAYPDVLSVSSVGPDRVLASYSSFGATVDIAAPGGDIADGGSTFGVISSAWNFVSGAPIYDTNNGTSMAAPHVSGVAALILANNPGLSPSQLRSRLTNFAVDAGASGHDNLYGAGIVNARNSLAQTFGPSRQLRARLYDALSGGVLQTVSVSSGGAYSFAGVTNGTYQVYAGQDESGDQLIGLPGRSWGAFGGTATALPINVSSTGNYPASFSIGLPAELEPNGALADADLLPVGGYLAGIMSPTDVDVSRVRIAEAGQYTFETSPVDGACGFALEENTLLALYDVDGLLISSNDDIDPDTFNFCSRVRATLSPGTYYVGVQGHFGGLYRVQARSGP